MAGGGRTGAALDERLAAELAAGRTIKDAATAASVSERTAHRRVADPAFQDRVTEHRAGVPWMVHSPLRPTITRIEYPMLNRVAILIPEPSVNGSAARNGRAHPAPLAPVRRCGRRPT